MKNLILTALLLLPAANLRAAEATAPARPNIILIMPDDLGYGDYSCLGAPIVRTPAVDAFKKQSVLFTQFHVSPTCSPTRAALLTGRHEFKNGVTHTIIERERLSLKSVTLPQMLKSAGYTTGIFGKWHLGDEEEYRPENRGFDEVFIHGGGGIGQTYPGSCGDAPGNSNIDPTLWHNGRFEKTNGFCTDVFFDKAEDWIDAQRSAGKPFFALITPNAAHTPLVVPEDYYKQYLGQPGLSEDLAKFYGMIENIDTNFGKLMAKLEEWKIADNTLVIYIGSDNGGFGPAVKIFNAGMRGNKVTPYQGGTRVPAFMRWPAAGIAAGTECDVLAAHIDIFPTLTAISGAELPSSAKNQADGHNLLPLLKNPKAERPERTLIHHVGRWEKGRAADAKYSGCSIQNSQFTLVNNTELYDLKKDPGETTNVIAEHPQVAEALRAEYDQWWEKVQPYMVNETAVGPKFNPLKEIYWKQFGVAPSEEDLKSMNPAPSQKSH